MPDIDLIDISKFVGAIATIVAGLLTLLFWLRPVKISPGVKLVLDGSGPDEITATVTNRSSKPIYITRCVSRGTYSRRHTALKHLRQPLMPFKFYSMVRFGGPTHELLSGEPIKIDAKQPIDFRHRLNTHPLSKFLTSEFLIEVEISTGRKFRSKRQLVPKRWQLQRAT